jgi:hypothetical protein
MIIPYHEEIRKFYDSSLNDSFLAGTNTIYNEALKTKNSYSDRWETIVNMYKRNQGYARDMSAASHLQTNSLIIGFNELKEAIILDISFLPQYIGVYFYHQTTHSEIPLLDGDGNYRYDLSFFPFTFKHEDLARKVLNNVSYYFKEFPLFNNLYAADKVKNVSIGGIVKEDSILFHTIFEDKMYTIF